MIEIKTPEEFIKAVRDKGVPVVLAIDYLRAAAMDEPDDLQPKVDDPGAFICWWLERPDQLHIDLGGHMGGYVYICENADDLKQIKICDLWLKEGEEPDVTERLSSWDVCDFVFGDADTKWGLFFMATNNAGGSIYYVPEALWEKSQFFKHYVLTNRDCKNEEAWVGNFRKELLKAVGGEDKEANVAEIEEFVNSLE